MTTSLMTANREKFEQVEATLTELSIHLTETIFERWAKVFGGEFSGREIILRLLFSGPQEDARIVLSIAFKDYGVTYAISERSLGFRWFFSFLLFTLYRVSANDHKPTLFLLDEPASNLHSAAQMQLLSSFSRVASNNSQILHSTHSHYLINPNWLDQAFIVSNHAVDYKDYAAARRGRAKPTNNIEIVKYRSFVGKNPDKITYFQPVLDKLSVVPSYIDNAKPAVIVEGKGDYIYIEYARKIVLRSLSSYNIVPTRGATGMDEIIGLYIGWGLKFAVCLDDDRDGILAAEKYKRDWANLSNSIFTLKDIAEDLAGKSIEGFLDVSDLDKIKAHFNLEKEPTKSQKQLYFSEMLSSKIDVGLSARFKEVARAFDDKFSFLLASDSI